MNLVGCAPRTNWSRGALGAPDGSDSEKQKGEKMPETHRLQAAHLHAMTRRIFTAASAPRHIADDVAEILVNANLAGHDSHGVIRIPAYLRGIERGGLVPDAEPRVTRETSNSLHLDGNGGFGHYAARQTMNRVLEKAKSDTMCYATLSRAGHIGRLGEYVEAAARAGCIGIVTTGGGGKGRGSTVPFGGAEGALGTNPIAVGVPTGDDTPFIIDFATTVVAEGKIQVARSKGVDLPEGCIIDKHGQPSVKPEALYDGGSMLTFGRHKGYALSLLVCLLGGLSGGFDLERGTMSGVYMQAVKVTTEGHAAGVRAFLDGIKSTPPAAGFDEVLVPGDVERRSRVQRLADGVELPDTIHRQIHECAEKLGVPIGEDTVEAADAQRYEM